MLIVRTAGKAVRLFNRGFNDRRTAFLYNACEVEWERNVAEMDNENMVTEMNAAGARALLMGCSCVVKSLLTPEQIEKFCIYFPEALVKKNDAGEEIFRIGVNGELPGSITPERAVFSKVTTVDGKATITVLIDPECEDRKAALMETVGPGLRQLEEMEPQLLAKLPDLEEKEKQAWELFAQL